MVIPANTWPISAGQNVGRRDKLDALRVGVARREELLASVIREALRPMPGGDDLVPTVVALTDFAVHRALTAAGMSSAAAADRVADIVITWIVKRRRSAHRDERMAATPTRKDSWRKVLFARPGTCVPILSLTVHDAGEPDLATERRAGLDHLAFAVGSLEELHA